jgi:hypothetical protein
MDGDVPLDRGKGGAYKIRRASNPHIFDVLLPTTKGFVPTHQWFVRNVWWASKEGKRKPCWVAWEEMVKPKFFGGLGFCDIELFNLALLAKQAWRILEDASSLRARILEVVYVLERDFLEAKLGSALSRIWRAILNGRKVLERGLIRRIGTGETTNIWDMNWIPREGRLRPVRRVLPGAPMLVSELIDATSATWDRQKLQAHLLPADVEAIFNMPLCTRRQDDVWAWHHERSGIFLSQVCLSDARDQ